MKLRPRLSPTLDRFLGGHFLGPFVVCLAAFTAAYLLGDIFDRFDDLMRYGGFGLLGLEYFALKLPLIISQLLPVASLAGVLLGFALLNRTGEVLACQQLGISRLEMAVPVLLLAALISIADFAISETVVPVATREAKHLYQVQLQRRKIYGIFFNRRIWVRVTDGFMSADDYDGHQKMLHGVTLYRVGRDYNLTQVEHAPSAEWNGKSWRPIDLTAFKLAPGARSRRPLPVRSGSTSTRPTSTCCGWTPTNSASGNSIRTSTTCGTRAWTREDISSTAILSTRCRSRA